MHQAMVKDPFPSQTPSTSANSQTLTMCVDAVIVSSAIPSVRLCPKTQQLGTGTVNHLVRLATCFVMPFISAPT